MIEEQFFNSNNLNSIFERVSIEVKNNTNVDITKHKSTKQQFQKMAHIVLNKFNHEQITLFELNEKLNINAVNFFNNLIANKKSNRSYSNVSPSEPTYNQTVGDSYVPPVTDVLVDNSLDSNMSSTMVKPISENEYNVEPLFNDSVGSDLPFVNNLSEYDETINIEDRINNYLTERNNISTTTPPVPPSQRVFYDDKVKPSDNAATQQAQLVEKETAMRRNLNPNQIEEYKSLDAKMDAKFAEITKRIETALIEPSLNTELMFKSLLKLQKDIQPKYMTRSNYIVINSGDRDWLNVSSQNRYNFQIKFGNHQSGASIKNVYKNITSIELVNAMLPKDNVLLPFDTRPYIDILTYPYLVMKIPQLTNVFRGTNQVNDNAFSVLIYDKKHDSQVLSNDFISGSNSIVNGVPSRQFYSEYNKSYYKYIPAYFEKKIYDNQPLSSLTNMDIEVVNPNDEEINVMPDVLSISAIAYTANLATLTTTDFEYDITNGYPFDAIATSNTREYLRIQTTTPFSSKLFRLGDNIKLAGLTAAVGSSTDEQSLVTFLNRNEGHYILNFDVTDYAVGGDKGFTSNLYIAPPGDLYTTGNMALNETTYIGSADADTGNITIGSSKLINTNLQTHFLFKINTREGDVSRVTMPMNV